MDLRYQPVKCCSCGAEYICRPESDYIHPEEMLEAEKTATNGKCLACVTKDTIVAEGDAVIYVPNTLFKEKGETS